MPAISIGLPVYNGAKHLEAALDSLLNQSFSDFEIIISDNASTDDTQSICERYASRDSRIKYFRQIENIGAPGNFRFVYEQAGSQLFKWMAHDDWVDPDWLSVLVPVAISRKAIVFGYLQMITYDGAKMDHKGNGREMEFAGASLWRQLAYANEPANLGKANIIYGIFPREVVTPDSFNIFSGYGAKGDVMMLTDCLRRAPILFAGPTRLYKRAAAPRPAGAPKEKRASVWERTMLRQFLTLEPLSFRIGYFLLYPMTLGRMKYGHKLTRLVTRLRGRAQASKA